MLAKQFGCGRLILGLLLGVGLVVSGGNAVAQDAAPYQGDAFCGVCHKDHSEAWMNKYNEYMQHGHRWVEVQTNGLPPGEDNFGLASVIGLDGNPVLTHPDPATINKPDPNNPGSFIPADWSDVRAMLGNFSGDGHYMLMSNGQRVAAGSTPPATWNTAATYTNMTKRCFRCHNPTGYSDVPTPDDDRIMYGNSASVWSTRVGNGTTIPYEYWFNGAPAKDPFGNRIAGVQCEHCHGPAGAMLGGANVDRKICIDCHCATSGDPVVPSGGDPEHRMQAKVSTDGLNTVSFPGHRPQGDEFRRSAHKAARAKVKPQGGGLASVQADEYVEQGCVLCHDPHKSVWHKKGGIKYVEDPTNEEEVGNMCTACHQKTDHDADFPAGQKPKKVRLRGAMGELGLLCVECHMPYKSVNGEEPMHLWRMWTGPDKLAAADHVSEVIDGKTWWTPTDPNGDASMTLDLVCADCHTNMSLEQMASYAKSIHRLTEMLDLTINGTDELQSVKKTDRVSVEFSVDAGAKNGVKAQWWVVCQGPRGWSSWNGKKWVAGLRPWRKNAALVDVPQQNVLNARLRPGYYNYWVCIYPKDDYSENVVSVPLYVKKR